MALDYDNIMRQLQESMTVLTAIESRHETRLQDHHEWLETLQMAHESERQLAAAHEKRLAEWQQAHEKRMADQEQSRAKWQEEHEKCMARMDEILLEVGEKLDARIHIVDDNISGKQQAASSSPAVDSHPLNS